MSEDYGNASELREEIGHPVVDADGHWIETAPVMKDFFLDFVKDLGGGDLAARFEAAAAYVAVPAAKLRWGSPASVARLLPTLDGEANE